MEGPESEPTQPMPEAQPAQQLAPNLLSVEADMTSSTLMNLTAPNWFNALFHNSNLESCTFQNCELDGSLFESCSLRGVELRNCDVEGLIINGVRIGTLLRLLLVEGAEHVG
jgi:uncharacterized protein YjbI with pentapeptide repeats